MVDHQVSPGLDKAITAELKQHPSIMKDEKPRPKFKPKDISKPDKK